MLWIICAVHCNIAWCCSLYWVGGRGIWESELCFLLVNILQWLHNENQTHLWTGAANSFTLPLLPSSLPASWPSSCGFLAYPFRLIHFCNATYRHPIFQKSSQWWGHNISRSLKYRVTPYTAGVWEDSPRACSGRIVAAQLEVWFGSQQPLQMEHTIRHLEIYSAHSWRLLM